MESETAIELKEGFSVADADYPEISLNDGILVVRFIDWQERTVSLLFLNTCAFKWQEASSRGPEPRDDTAYEIVNSEWVAKHLVEQVRAPEEKFRHFKLCFNACGVLEVIASKIEVATYPKSAAWFLILVILVRPYYT